MFRLIFWDLCVCSTNSVVQERLCVLLLSRYLRNIHVRVFCTSSNLIKSNYQKRKCALLTKKTTSRLIENVHCWQKTTSRLIFWDICVCVLPILLCLAMLSSYLRTSRLTFCTSRLENAHLEIFFRSFPGEQKNNLSEKNRKIKTLRTPKWWNFQTWQVQSTSTKIKSTWPKYTSQILLSNNTPSSQHII